MTDNDNSVLFSFTNILVSLHGETVQRAQATPTLEDYMAMLKEG